MSTTERTMTVRKGTDAVEPIIIENGEGGYLDVTSDTITMTVEDSDGTDVLSLSVSGGDITVINGTGGHIEVAYTSADIASLTVGNDYWRTLTVVHGGYTRTVMNGKFVVRAAL